MRLLTDTGGPRGVFDGFSYLVKGPESVLRLPRVQAWFICESGKAVGEDRMSLLSAFLFAKAMARVQVTFTSNISNTSAWCPLAYWARHLCQALLVSEAQHDRMTLVITSQLYFTLSE